MKKTTVKILPKADYIPDKLLFTVNYSVWINKAFLCYCDTEYRANLMTKIINDWRKSPQGKKWWKERQKLGK